MAVRSGLGPLDRLVVVSRGTNEVNEARSFDEEELRRMGGPPPTGTKSTGSGGEAEEMMLPIGIAIPAFVPPAPVSSSFLRPTDSSGPVPNRLISVSLVLILRTLEESRVEPVETVAISPSPLSKCSTAVERPCIEPDREVSRRGEREKGGGGGVRGGGEDALAQVAIHYNYFIDR